MHHTACAVPEHLQRYLQLTALKRDFEQKAREADQRIKEAAASILDAMGTAERATLTSDGMVYTVSYASRYRHSIKKEDLERLKLEYPAVYDTFVSVSESRCCTVKAKEEKRT